VSHILILLKFVKYPLMMQFRHPLLFKVGEKKIFAKCDIAILKNHLVSLDKHIKNTRPETAWGEYQISGEMIAGAYNNYLMSPKKYNDTINAVRVVGLKFTFYKAIITSKYLASLIDGLPIDI